MRLHLLKIFTALIIFPAMAFADTVTYDYATDTSGTPGVDIFAYSGTTSSQPTNSSTEPSGEFNTNNYTYIESDDNQFSSNQSSGNNSYASQRFTIEINEDESSVSEMLINWKGYGTNARNNQSDGVAFYIWNYSDSSYEEIGNTGDTTSEISLSKTISSDISDYINVNTITLFATTNDSTNRNNRNNLIATNYISLVITYENTLPVPILDYHFDELSWNGSADEVFDSSGNINHGVALGSISTITGKLCSAADIPLNENTATIEAVDSEVDLDTSIGSTGTISLWYKGNDDWDSGSGLTKRLFDATDGNKYFFAEIRDDGRIKFWFEDGNDGDYQKTTVNALTIASDVWKHLTFVWDVTSQTSKIFVDGVEQSLTGGNGGTTSFSGYDTLYIGDNKNTSYITSNSSADGQIDEVLVFNAVLTDAQIQTIFSNQDSGKNYDGSARTCPELIAEYRFEEDSWNGSDGEILDSTGNGYHGQQIRGSTLVNPGINSALSGNPGTCGYASQNSGSIQITDLPVDTSAGAKTTVTFWMYWDGTDNVMPLGWYYHDIWIFNGSIGFNTWNNDRLGVSSSGLSNGWHHIAVEFTNGSVTNNRMHIDGIEQTLVQQYTTHNNSTAYVNAEMRIGGVSNTSYYDFHGFLDEVRVYKGALTTTEINTIMNETHACETEVIDHYEIIHDGSGLTCNAESVIIKACTDSACSSLSSESITLDLQATSASSGIETKGSVTFDNGFGEVSFNHFTAETITLSIANENIDATNATICSGSIGASCDISFADSGFIFDVPTQTACATSDAITISAVRKDVTTQQCVPSFESVNKTLKFWNSFDSPTTATQDITLTQNSTNYSLPSSEGISVPINFDANGQATFQVTYPDAGQLTLNASYDGTVSNNDLGLRMTGSDQFVSVPAKLVVATSDSNASCSTNNASCSAFKAAGDDFNLAVSATCADGTVTANFQMNDITLSVNDISPDIGNPVSLGITNVNISDADNGVHNESTQSISEVGVFSITATPNNLYFTETIAAATSESIGRFTPAYYQLGDINNGALSGGNPFVYTGQMETTTSSIGQISYLTPPEFTITAKSISGSTTLNYTGDFIKLTESSIDRDTPTQDATQLGKDSINEVDLSASLNTPVFAEYTPGVLKYQFNSSDHYVYNRNANSLIAPFTTDIDLVINSIIDSDSIQATDNDSDTSNGVLTLQPTGLEIRFGRWIMENSYGPETSDIRIPMSTQYWNASYFVNNDEDSFTSFSATDASITDNQLSPTATPNIVGSGLFTSGETSELTVESPGANVRGSVIVEHDVPSWLKYDWSVIDASYDEDPSAIATFGLYRGNDRIIYRQEVFD